MINRYKLVITGRNPDYFLKKIIKKKINIYDLEKSHKKIYIVVDDVGLDDIRSIKTSYKIQVVGRLGLARVEYIIKKYMLFLIFFVFGIFVNIFLSNIIFDVDVVHSNPYIRELVFNDLKKYGIKKYNFKVSYAKKEKIVNKIVSDEKNDIEWLEIDSIGTKYIVKVEQRKKNKDKETCVRRNIVAKKDAMILGIEATEGEILKKKLDYVKKGDIIVSGVIYNKEKIVAQKCATGKVYGEVWYLVSLDMPVNYKEENVTGRVKKQLEFKFLNKEFHLFSHFKSYKRKSYSIISNNLLPISLDFTSYFETKVKSKNYTLDNIEKDAISLATNKLTNKIGKDSEIVSKKVLKKYKKNSKIIVEVFFKVKEDITEYLDYEEIVQGE